MATGPWIGDWCTVAEAADRLGVDEATVTAALDAGWVPSVRVDGRPLMPWDGLSVLRLPSAL